MTELTNHPVLTVSQLSQAIKFSVEKTFPLVWLQGEMSNCKPHTSGHLYFSLKDANAQISAVMFRPDAATLKFPPKDGTQVIAKGELNVYPASGKYQIVVRELRPVGVGELLLKLEELKIKLTKQGWFRKEHKKALPKFPKRIGVVTSPTGAAIHDMLNILTRRFSGFHLILYPVRVQGEGSAQEIAHAIEEFNRYQLADVLIVGRGGGSIEDLWAFNEEIVAKAIFDSHIPIIAAVGHETDHCIADYVADLRAPTPSAAAEIVIAEKSQQLHHLKQVQFQIRQHVTHLMQQYRHRLQNLMRFPVIQTPYGILGQWLQRIDSLRLDVDQAIRQRLLMKKLTLDSKKQELKALKPSARLEHYRQKFIIWEREIKGGIARKLIHLKQSLIKSQGFIDQSWRHRQNSQLALFQESEKRKQLQTLYQRSVSKKYEQLEMIKTSLSMVNPKNILSKGYCILFSEKDYSAITSINAVKTNDQVRILLSDGKLLTTINEILPK